MAGGDRRRTRSVGAIQARWLRSADGRRARRRDGRGVRPVAGRAARARCGRGHVGRDRRAAPGRARRGRRTSIVLGIGGSATTDGGAGLLAGARRGRPIAIGAVADLAGLDPRLAGVDLAVACDVSNPLLGPSGAAAIYGPQKGATPADVAELDRRLARCADALEAAAGRARPRRRPGPARPAASGSRCWPSRTGSGRSPCGPASTSSWRRPTSPARLASADLVITGEGRIDAQTGVRQDRARGRAAGGRGGRAVHRGRWRRRARGDRGARARSARSRCPVVERPQSVEEAMAAGRRRRSSAAASGWRASSSLRLPSPRRVVARSSRWPPRRARAPTAQAPVLEPRPDLGQAPRALPARARAVRARRAGRASTAGPTWQRRLDPTSELILTILTQNSADTNAEVAFEALRTRYPGTGEVAAAQPGRRLGRRRAARRRRARLGGDRVRATPRAGRDDLAGRARQPEGAADPGDAAARSARNAATTRSSSSASMSALEARDWLTRIDGIGKKTASVLLLFSFGLPLMPVDRHVERVAAAGRADRPRRPRPTTPTTCSSACSQPDQMYEAHVNLIQHGRKVCHAQRPDHDACPLRPRCRFVDPKAP